MKEKIKKLFRFEGFGDVEKIVGLIFIFIAFVLIFYMYFVNIFNI